MKSILKWLSMWSIVIATTFIFSAFIRWYCSLSYEFVACCVCIVAVMSGLGIAMAISINSQED